MGFVCNGDGDLLGQFMVFQGELIKLEIETEPNSEIYEAIAGSHSHTIDTADHDEYRWGHEGEEPCFSMDMEMFPNMKSRKWARRRTNQKLKMLFKKGLK